MYISRITPLLFKSRIIDSHAHVGTHDGKLYTKGSLDVFVKSPLPNGDKIEKMIVSDLDVLHGVKDEFIGNSDTKNALEGDSDYAVLASCNPANGNIENIKKLFQENPNSFVGLKFHPTFQQISPLDSQYEPYYKFAEKYKLPCLFHTAVNVDENGILLSNKEPYSDPEFIYKAAKKYPKIPFVLAHMGSGWNQAHDKAINILLESIRNNDANLYADISWVDIDNPQIEEHSPKEHIVKAIKELKGIDNPNWPHGDQSFRLLFGTDVPLARFHDWTYPEALNDYAKFVDDIKFAIRNDNALKENSEKIIEDLFCNNAKKLYLKAKKRIKII